MAGDKGSSSPTARRRLRRRGIRPVIPTRRDQPRRPDFDREAYRHRNQVDEIIRRLKLRAARHGRSAEAEHRAILEEALRAEEARQLSPEEFWALADRLRAEGPRMPDGSTDLIRRMRDER